MYVQQTSQQRHDRLGFTLFLAGSVHLALILGIGFEGLTRSGPSPTQLSVTLAVRNDAAPEDAQHIAERNQQAGAAEQAEIDMFTQVQPLAQPAPVTPTDTQSPQPTADTNQPSNARLVTSTSASELQRQADVEDPNTDALTTQTNPEIAQLNQQLTSLQAELDAQNRAYATRPKVRRLTSLSARESIDAAYLHQWRTRVEAVGNRYYPEASVRYGIYGSLRLLVVVRADGSLENIEVLSSSGHTLLDEAAVKIVRLAAPFEPFPQSLRATADKLEIIRTWQFQQNRLSAN